ncbi:MAG: DegT/DnrJ/EryC1/StrS family aminotransferase [Myxococcota bacterium]|nr:DegT/DnrJ/EryC1/StrS family aminotransferase [Myxococcota bacterium]
MTKLAVLGGSPVIERERHGKWPIVDDDCKRAVMAVLERGVLSGSDAPEARAFQEEFADFQGAKHALLTHSGTSALQVAIGAQGIGEGDEVIVPAYSFVATALAVVTQGAIPIFVDVKADGNLDPAQLAGAISERTKAIMPVHVHGNPADLDEILAFARKHGLRVIEDAAQAHGATYAGKKVGTFDAGGGFSLQSSKNLSAGEGGVYVTDDEDALERANQIRNFAQNVLRGDGKHWDADRPLDGHKALVSTGIGSMYRGNEMMAAFARVQLRKLGERTARAQENGARLAAALRELPGVTPPISEPNRKSVFHKYRVWMDPAAAGVDLAPAQLRDAMLRALRAEGCEVVLWQGDPMPSFPLFQDLRGYGKGFPFRAGDLERIRANYRAENFPGSRRLLDSSIVLFSQTCPLIAQDSATVDRYADAFRKVWERRADLAEVARTPR